MFEEQKDYKVSSSVSISLELKKLMDAHNISISRACEFGAKFLMAEKTKGIDVEFPDNALSYKIAKMSEIIEQQTNRITELEEAIAFRGVEKKEAPLSDKDLKEILKDGSV